MYADPNRIDPPPVVTTRPLSKPLRTSIDRAHAPEPTGLLTQFVVTAAAVFLGVLAALVAVALGWVFIPFMFLR
jgi:hypothetical protein